MTPLTHLAVCLLIASPLLSQPTLEEWKIERHEWRGEVPEGTSVTVDNPWGDLAVRAHKRAELYLLANSQRHRDDPRAVDLKVRQEPETLTIEIAFAEAELDAEPQDWVKRRVDVTVFVPELAATRFSTHKGALEIRGTRSPTHATSWAGDLRLRTYGSVTATSEYGSVLAQFQRTDWLQPVEITTLTGDIRVEMPQGGRAEVVIETRGEITSDYSTEVVRVAGSQLKRARVAAGGGKVMRLTSNRGAIQIVESLVPEERDTGDEP